MRHPERDLRILEHMLSYCEQIEETIRRFGNSSEVFHQDAIYRNAAALCILQIGELVGNLSENFRIQHPAVPWRQIKAMRNIVAHRYGTIDPDTTWEIMTEDIPALKQFCQSMLAHRKRTVLMKRLYKQGRKIPKTSGHFRNILYNIPMHVYFNQPSRRNHSCSPTK